MTTAAVILAAGSSRRFGPDPKQLVDWLGVPLLEHVVTAVREWPVDEVFVVLGSDAETIMESVDLGGVTVVENPGWEEGMASSLRVGLDAVSNAKGIERAFVVLGDQPHINGAVAERLLAEQKRSGLPVAIPRYRYTWGHPVLIDRSLWGRLMATISGDRGAQGALKAHPEWVEEVWFEDLAPRDVDTRMDLEEMRPRPRPS